MQYRIRFLSDCALAGVAAGPAAFIAVPILSLVGGISGSWVGGALGAKGGVQASEQPSFLALELQSAV